MRMPQRKSSRRAARLTAAGIVISLALVFGVSLPILATRTAASSSRRTTPRREVVQTGQSAPAQGSLSNAGRAETPTPDATVAALDKDKLKQEVEQLQRQNAPTFDDWLHTNAAVLLSSLLVVAGGLFGLLRWLGDRRDERQKRAEERFQEVVTALGNANESAKFGGAVLLRTFAGPGHDQFSIQVFDQAVAHLLSSQTHQQTGVTREVVPFTVLRRALVAAFKEAFPRARKANARASARWFGEMVILRSLESSDVIRRKLDATGVTLDNLYLAGADLREVWMPEAFLRSANLAWANLTHANLINAHLNDTDLTYSDLTLANLEGADLTRADLNWANLTRADLTGAILTGTTISKDTILTDTILCKVQGLTKPQLEICKGRGAIIDCDENR
jgi:uncharacterized protein YjbI with pentapeptide repeats